MAHMSLFTEPATNREKAIAWMDEHPLVMQMFERRALEKAAIGIELGEQTAESARRRVRPKG